MSLENTICPLCRVQGAPTFNSLPLYFPPNGGDYDWVELDCTANCQNCGHEFPVRVQYDLEHQEVSKIIEIIEK
jgi:hypothetical protein